MLRAQCGDRPALEALLRSVQPALSRYVRSIAGPDQADEVLQNVLVILFRRLGSLENPAAFRPWAFRVASREALRRLRKTQRLREVDAEELAELPTTDWHPPDPLLAELVQSDVLSVGCRSVLLLHFQEGLTLAEVSVVLELPLGTVKSRLAYGLAALRRHFHARGLPHG